MDDFELLGSEDYYQALLKEVPKAKKRVVVAAMAMLWGERTAPIFIMLQDAIRRGVKVTVLVDNYSRLTHFLGLQPSSSGKERLRQTFRTLEDLSAQGAKVHLFGKIGIVPHKGRCHVKISIVDDVSFSFGGVNFYDEMFERTDYMLKSTNPDVADCLEQLVNRIIKTRPPLLDGEVKLDKNNYVLFDGGRPKRSLIYERACELSSQAKKVYFAGAMTPSGELARLLNEADAAIYSNRPEIMLPLDGIGQAFDLQKYRINNLYKGNNPIHSKMMLFEMPNGKKALLSGSHNFSYRGVSFGTQEICLYSTDEKLWDKLYSYLRRQIINAAE